MSAVFEHLAPPESPISHFGLVLFVSVSPPTHLSINHPSLLPPLFHTHTNRTNATSHYPLDGSKCGYTGEGQHSGVSKHYFTTFSVHGMKASLEERDFFIYMHVSPHHVHLLNPNPQKSRPHP